MINIVFQPGSTRGPGKVFTNLMKGLEKIGFRNFELNSEPGDAFDRVCVLSNSEWLAAHAQEVDPRFILGPNLFVLPSHDSSGVVGRMAYRKYIQPSAWALDIWREWLPAEKLVCWPVGVDTEAFPSTRNHEKAIDLLVYVKHRPPELVAMVARVLAEQGRSARFVEYGSYSEEDFKSLLSNSRAAVWVGAHESQGLAVQECMSSDVPMLVLDVESTAEEIGWPAFLRYPATAVPYWHERCGQRIVSSDLDRDRLHDALLDFWKNVAAGDYEPRSFIVENLGLERQAEAFLAI